MFAGSLQLLLPGHPCYYMDTPATAWTPLLLHGHRCYCMDTAATVWTPLLLPAYYFYLETS